MFYAGHGLQIDGENFLVPVDIDPKREADIPMQAVRLNDILNTLTSVPSKMRILMLDACRNNPFPDINKTAGRGLAIVDAKIGAPGTFMSFSTSPGADAEDGNGANSPYTTALLAAGKEPNIPIEETFKRVRLAVNKVTEGRQTPWDSSSLTEDFRFSGTAVAGPKPAAAPKKTVAEWTRDLKGKPVEAANELIVADGTDEAYEAFAGLYRADRARAAGARLARSASPHGGVERRRAPQHRVRISRLPGAIPRQRSLRDRAQAGSAAAQPSRIHAGGCRRQRGRAAERCAGRADLSLQRAAAADAAAALKVNAPVRRVEPDPPKKRPIASRAGPSRMTTSWSFAVRPRAWCTMIRRRRACTSHRDRRSASASALVSVGLAADAAATTMADRRSYWPPGWILRCQ